MLPDPSRGGAAYVTFLGISAVASSGPEKVQTMKSRNRKPIQEETEERMPLRDVDEQLSKGVLMTALVTTREWRKASLARSHCGQWTRSRCWWKRHCGLWMLVEQAVLWREAVGCAW